MRFTRPTSKTFLIVSCCFLGALVLFFVNFNLAQAAHCDPLEAADYGCDHPAGDEEGSATNPAPGAADESTTASRIAYWIIAAIAGIIQKILAAILYHLSQILQKTLEWNVQLLNDPVIMGFITTGWGIVRDAANAFFIIIVLWIALTIIFNLEEFGGRQLLFRVIVVALLVNFSLVFVTTLFGFTNSLALTFYNKLPPQGVGIYIKNKLAIDSLKEFRTAPVGDKDSLAPTDPSFAANRAPVTIGWKNALASSLGIESAHAVFPGILWWIGGLAIGAVAGYFVTSGTPIQVLSGLAISRFMADLFLFTVIIAFFFATFALIARLVAAAVLGVLAPAAFLLHILPGGYGKQYWDMWLSNLIKWSFFAPIFFFFLYLSLALLNQLTPPELTPGTHVYDDQRFIFATLISCGFLIASVIISQKMGGAIASTALSWGKRLVGTGVGLAAGGVIKGGAAAGRLAMRAAPETTQKVAGRVAEFGARLGERGGLMGKYIGRRVVAGAANVLEKQKADAEEYAKKIGSYNPEQQAQLFRIAAFPDQKLGVALSLARGGNIGLLNNEQRKEALRYAKTVGLEKEVLRAAPEISENIKEAMALVRPQDAAKWGKKGVFEKDKQGNFVYEAAAKEAAKTFSSAHYNAIAGGGNPENIENLITVFEKFGKEIHEDLKRAAYAPGASVEDKQRLQRFETTLDYFETNSGMQMYRQRLKEAGIIGPKRKTVAGAATTPTKTFTPEEVAAAEERAEKLTLAPAPCPPGQHWDATQNRCVPDDKPPTGGVGGSEGGGGGGGRGSLSPSSSQSGETSTTKFTPRPKSHFKPLPKTPTNVAPVGEETQPPAPAREPILVRPTTPQSPRLGEQKINLTPRLRFIAEQAQMDRVVKIQPGELEAEMKKSGFSEADIPKTPAERYKVFDRIVEELQKIQLKEAIEKEKQK